jgi:hypothetical protein
VEVTTAGFTNDEMGSKDHSLFILSPESNGKASRSSVSIEEAVLFLEEPTKASSSMRETLDGIVER